MDISKPATTVTCWVDLYSDKMYTWALHKTSSIEIAEDLVQETFLAAFQSIRKFEGKSEPQTWLFAILNNKIAEHFRKQFRNPAITESQSDTSIFDTLFDANDQWLKEQRPKQWQDEQTNLLDDAAFIKILQACMGKLPGNWMAAVRLKYLEEKKGELICQELGITPTNFWQILHRAKLQLRKCLEVNWFTP
ncbi:MAG: sigma-70 family RNA polymerase sigma factor [Sphingobacteriales bacterium]|nr:sigma-70 family RNA polymerase sigma factor [Sphingobacteriales bacterium]